MATKKTTENNLPDDPIIEVTARQEYPGNGMLGIPAWKNGETRLLSKSIFDKLIEDMPYGWVIKLH